MKAGNSLETLPAEYERYRVQSRFTIVSLLREVMDSRAFVTIYFNNGSEFIVTNLLQVNPELEELIFGPCAESAGQKLLSAPAPTTAVTFVDRIRLQFSAPAAETTTFEHAPALRLRFPNSMLRLQRRHFQRIRAPAARPLFLSLPHPERTEERMQLRILDFSCGGVGMLAGDDFPYLETGTHLQDCRIELPEFGIVRAVLEIRSATPTDASGEGDKMRYGCQFVDLSGPTITLIQRYIDQLELSRAAES
jgi:c-di-GMP-binding flagellar brake protein YcgR